MRKEKREFDDAMINYKLVDDDDEEDVKADNYLNDKRKQKIL